MTEGGEVRFNMERSMQPLLIRNVRLDGQLTDVRMEGGRFSRIAPGQEVDGAEVLEGGGKAMTPPFYNTHTHAAMSLLRGYADDLELFAWLREYIWPIEGRMTVEDIYHGTRLAIVEMIRSGTVFFNDMYWHPVEAARAVESLGVRAAIGMLFIEGEDGEVTAANRRGNAELLEASRDFPERIQLAYAPHSVYTVSGPMLRRVSEAAGEDGRRLHIHVSETAGEVKDALERFGMSPVAWLDRHGILGPRTILAHAIHLSPADLELIAARGSVIAHMPCSNYKLASGYFPYHQVRSAGISITLGTDGCCSNNNLSMLEEMKFAALNAKCLSGQPTAAPAAEILQAATEAGAAAFGLDAGVIAEGKMADAMLLDLDHCLLVPDHNFVSNLVYSADSSCIDTVICGGRVLMRGGRIDGESEIIGAARCCAARLASGG